MVICQVVRVRHAYDVTGKRVPSQQNRASTIAYDVCAPGRGGRLCGRCDVGTSELLFTTDCVANSECTGRYDLLIALAVYGALYVAFFAFEYDYERFVDDTVKRTGFRRRGAAGGDDELAISDTGYFQIFMYYIQTAALLKVRVGCTRVCGVCGGCRALRRVCGRYALILPTLTYSH